MRTAMKYTPPISEDAFQSQVIDLARALGWKTAHFRPALTKSGNWITAVAGDGKGFPDLVLVRDRVIFAELKRDTEKPSSAQRDWLDALERAGVEVYVWRPADFDDIVEVLKKRRIELKQTRK